MWLPQVTVYSINGDTDHIPKYSVEDIQRRNMLKTVLFISLLSSSLGWKVSRSLHHFSNRFKTTTEAPVPENCVDISRYGEVQYSPAHDEVCTSSIKTTCVPRSEKVCVNVPKTTFTFNSGADCTNVGSTHTVSGDRTEEKNFTPKKCLPNGYETISEVKKVPDCKNVTKEVCDSKWVIDASGKKVFANNVNCRPKTWQQCELVDMEITEKVPVKKCIDDEDLWYLTPVFDTMEVTSYKRSCSAIGGASYKVTHTTECTEVTWSDCSDQVERSCQPVSSNVPFQEYNHLKRCAINQ